MVKKPQAKGGKPGGGGGTKKPSPATTTGDDSFIVFSNSDKDPKPKRSAGPSDAGPSGHDGPELAGEAPKRPDVKKLIGGASWTGKLPVNMLSEHCQKQKWEKPEYTMVRLCWSLSYTADGSTSYRARHLKGFPPWLSSNQRIQKHKSSFLLLHSNYHLHINISL